MVNDLVLKVCNMKNYEVRSHKYEKRIIPDLASLKKNPFKVN